jgi:hypothetical protein
MWEKVIAAEFKILLLYLLKKMKITAKLRMRFEFLTVVEMSMLVLGIATTCR